MQVMSILLPNNSSESAESKKFDSKKFDSKKQPVSDSGYTGTEKGIEEEVAISVEKRDDKEVTSVLTVLEEKGSSLASLIAPLLLSGLLYTKSSNTFFNMFGE